MVLAYSLIQAKVSHLRDFRDRHRLSLIVLQAQGAIELHRPATDLVDTDIIVSLPSDMPDEDIQAKMLLLG